MVCRMSMIQWLKDAYLFNQNRLHSLNFLLPILSKPLSSRHFLKILTENIIYAHCFLKKKSLRVQNAIQLGISLSYPKSSIPPSSHLKHSHQEPVSCMALQAYSRHLPVIICFPIFNVQESIAFAFPLSNISQRAFHNCANASTLLFFSLVLFF